MKYLSSLVVASIVAVFSGTALASETEALPKPQAPKKAEHRPHGKPAHAAKVHKVSAKTHDGKSHKAHGKPKVEKVSTHKSHEPKAHEGKGHVESPHVDKVMHTAKPGLVKVSTKKVDAHVNDQVTLHMGIRHADAHEEPKPEDLAFPDLTEASLTRASKTNKGHKGEEVALLAKVRFKKSERQEPAAAKPQSSRTKKTAPKPSPAKTDGDDGEAPPAESKDNGNPEGSGSEAPCARSFVPTQVTIAREGKEQTVLFRGCDGELTTEFQSALRSLAQSERKASDEVLNDDVVFRVAKIVDHFRPRAKSGAITELASATDVSLSEVSSKPKSKTMRLEIVSGVRPESKGSFHGSARAVDFRLVGVANEQVVAYCKTLADTGCGYYPNSTFLHVDARDSGKGSVFWIDASKPGEPPRYVKSWPEN
jgi:uncharacterized protein YcbK (DUF882 family)